ncbi:MAG: hypothetical protein ACLU4P_00525 [Ruminococcus sp.]
MKLLTNSAQMFADVRTYWSGDAIKRVTGYDIEGVAKETDGVDPSDQLPEHAVLDANGCC